MKYVIAATALVIVLFLVAIFQGMADNEQNQAAYFQKTGQTEIYK
jgi:hypothetical protein